MDFNLDQSTNVLIPNVSVDMYKELRHLMRFEIPFSDMVSITPFPSRMRAGWVKG